MPRVFVSYNSNDRQQARALILHLMRFGIDCFFDERERPDTEGVPTWIAQGLSSSDAALFCLGAGGLGKWQKLEVDLAINLHIKETREFRILNAVLPGVMGRPDVPPLLARYPWVEFPNGFSDAQAMDRLILILTGRRPSRSSDALRVAPDPVAADPVDAAVRRMVTTLRLRPLTYFVGARCSEGEADMPPLPWELAQDLLLELNLIEERQPVPLLPSVDWAGSFYSMHEGGDRLEVRVRDKLRDRSATVPLMQLRLGRLVKLLLAWQRKRSQHSTGAVGNQAPPHLIVTTRLDLLLERTLLQQGVSFRRVVQCRDGSRVETAYAPSVSETERDVAVSYRTGKASSVSALTSQQLDAAIANESAQHKFRHGAAFRSHGNEPVVLYKYHGSWDIEHSCTLTTEHLFDAFHVVRVPKELTQIMGNTGSLFLGCSILDVDFRHLYHSMLERVFEESVAGVERFTAQLKPAVAYDRGVLAMEARIWDNIKRTAQTRLGLAIVEERPELLLEKLTSAVLAEMRTEP